eukprot:364675-Chlamydomonas_euryale.AAC.6
MLGRGPQPNWRRSQRMLWKPVPTSVRHALSRGALPQQRCPSTTGSGVLSSRQRRGYVGNKRFWPLARDVAAHGDRYAQVEPCGQCCCDEGSWTSDGKLLLEPTSRLMPLLAVEQRCHCPSPVRYRQRPRFMFWKGPAELHHRCTDVWPRGRFNTRHIWKARGIHPHTCALLQHWPFMDATTSKLLPANHKSLQRTPLTRPRPAPTVHV